MFLSFPEVKKLAMIKKKKKLNVAVHHSIKNALTKYSIRSVIQKLQPCSHEHIHLSAMSAFIITN